MKYRSSLICLGPLLLVLACSEKNDRAVHIAADTVSPADAPPSIGKIVRLRRFDEVTNAYNFFLGQHAVILQENELRTLGTDITFGRYGGKNVLAIGMSGGAKTKLTMLPPVIHHGRSIFQEIFRNDKGIVNPHSGSLLAEIDTEDLSGGVKTGEAKIGATYLLEYGANRHVPQRVILLRIIGRDPSNYIDIRWKRLDIVGLGVTR